MPTTRSRALKSNNPSVPDPKEAVQPAVPPPDRHKRKRSRVEIEIVASTGPDGENGALISAANTVLSKKRKKGDKKPAGRKTLAKKPDMPPEPVTVKVVDPAPPEVSQKAMRTAGSVIAKFDPWKMRDGTFYDSDDFEVDDVGAPIDNSITYNESASPQSAMEADEQQPATESSMKHDLASQYGGGGTEAATEARDQATNAENEVWLEVANMGVLGGVSKVLGVGDMLESLGNSEGTSKSFMIENETSDQRQTSASTNGHRVDENLRPDSEVPVLPQRLEAEANGDSIHDETPTGIQCVEDPPITAPSGHLLLRDAEPPVAFQEQSPFLRFVLKPNDDTNAASSVCSEDAEGSIDEDHFESVQFEDLSQLEQHDEVSEDAVQEEEAETGMIGGSESTTTSEECGVENEIDPPQHEVSSGTMPAGYQQLAENGGSDDGIEAYVLEEDTHLNCVEINEIVKPDRAAPSRSDVDREEISDGDEKDQAPASIKADYPQNDLKYSHSALHEKARGGKSIGREDHLAGEAEGTNEDFDDDLGDFSSDEEAEQQRPERDGDTDTFKANTQEGDQLIFDIQDPGMGQPVELNDCHGTIEVTQTGHHDSVIDEMSDPDNDGTSYDSGEREEFEEDPLCSLFGSSRNTPEPEETEDRTVWGGSRVIALPSSEGELEDDINVEPRRKTETDGDCSSTSSDQDSPGGGAETEKQILSESPLDINRAVQNAPWRQTNAFANVQLSTPGIAERKSSSLPEVAMDSLLPPGMQEVLSAWRIQHDQATNVKETDALLKGIHDTLTRSLEIQQREFIANERFRHFVMSRLLAEPPSE